MYTAVLISYGLLFSFVICGLPTFLPLAFAVSIPLRTLARIMDRSSSAKTSLIWMNVWVMVRATVEMGV